MTAAQPSPSGSARTGWVRPAHRWLSIVFTACVVANFGAMAFGPPVAWIVYSPLPPLALMLLTGLYLFMQPYRPRWGP